MKNTKRLAYMSYLKFPSWKALISINSKLGSDPSQEHEWRFKNNIIWSPDCRCRREERHSARQDSTSIKVQRCGNGSMLPALQAWVGVQNYGLNQHDVDYFCFAATWYLWPYGGNGCFPISRGTAISFGFNQRHYFLATNQACWVTLYCSPVKYSWQERLH